MLLPLKTKIPNSLAQFFLYGALAPIEAEKSMSPQFVGILDTWIFLLWVMDHTIS